MAVSPNLEEVRTYVDLAFYIDDGEAYTGAIAIHRGWALAIDGKKTIRVMRQTAPAISILSTLDLVKHWVEVTKVPVEVIREVLKDIRIRAYYEPHRSHPLYEWWQSYLG